MPPSLGLAEDSEAQYQAYSYTTFSLRRTPSESDRGISVQKKTKILILEWDDAWCKVQVGNKVGYAKPEWLYRVQSLVRCAIPCKICRIA